MVGCVAEKANAAVAEQEVSPARVPAPEVVVVSSFGVARNQTDLHIEKRILSASAKCPANVQRFGNAAFSHGDRAGQPVNDVSKTGRAVDVENAVF